ncbi:MAG TPA: hypothetical protein PK529_11090 [Verrucomicrobiales bacterium]|nr:hypothetical protein [Verrucomicrobiales bacterium]
MEAILTRLNEGVKPTAILRELRIHHGGICNFDLAGVFLEEIWTESNTGNCLSQYEEVNTLDIVQPIWHWHDTREQPGAHTDEEIDTIILQVLSRANLLRASEENKNTTEHDGRLKGLQP